VLQVHHSGYYAWRRNAHSQRHHEDQRLLALVKASWLESARVYGYRKVHHDLRALGESCSRHRVARLMRIHGWRAQVGYRRRPGSYGGIPHSVAANILDRQFDVAAPNTAWVTDITYIRTHEGWLYLAVVLDLFSRQVVGWSMDSRMSKDLVLQALLAAVWRRKPKQRVMVHSDRGSQYASDTYQTLLTQYGIRCSMSRKGNCWDNAVMERFFLNLKMERVWQRDYANHVEAEKDVTHYIVGFYNVQRLHSTLGYIAPVDYELQNNVEKPIAVSEIA